MKENKKRTIYSDGVKAYFRETTVHGFSYLADGSNLFEKIVWILVILSGMICCCSLILSSYNSWNEMPGTEVARITVVHTA